MPTSNLRLFQMAIMQSWNAVVITDACAEQGYRVQIANPAFCRMTGYALAELQGASLKRLQGPETNPEVLARMRACLREGRYFEGTAINYRQDASPYLVHWNISPVRDDDGLITHFVSVQQDLSAYARSELQNQLLLRALDATGDPVLITDTQARIIFVNSAFAAISGYAESEILGKTPAMFRSGRHDAAFYGRLRQALQSGQEFRATFVNRRRDGSLYHAEQSISPIFNDAGHVTHYVSVSKDISDRVALEHTLRRAAEVDPLSGLHNRGYGERWLQRVHEEVAATFRPVSLLLCDIDHFKQVNDRFGHAAGDRTIRQVATVLLSQVAAAGDVFRWGGEEFLVALDATPAAVAHQVAESIRQAVQNLHDAEVGPVTLSLGVATLQPGELVVQWLERVDAALYRAKGAGRNRVCIATN